MLGRVVGIVAAIGALWVGEAYPRDLGQWDEQDPELTRWYQELMRPDAPASSCCGEADAYFCDDYGIRGGEPSCIITDDRPDEPRKRPHIDIGTVIRIPHAKLKWDRGNPTGHGVVFMSWQRYVFCYVQPGGA